MRCSRRINIARSVWLLLAELRRAIEQNQLYLEYQPKIDLCTGRVSGVEALVRWRHPKLGIVPPDQFISLAERTGLMKPLTSWVLNEAIRQCIAWNQVGLKVSAAVNISRRASLPAFSRSCRIEFANIGAQPPCFDPSRPLDFTLIRQKMCTEAGGEGGEPGRGEHLRKQMAPRQDGMNDRQRCGRVEGGRHRASLYCPRQGTQRPSQRENR